MIPSRINIWAICLPLVIVLALLSAIWRAEAAPSQADATPLPFLALGDGSTLLCLPITTVLALTTTPDPTPTRIPSPVTPTAPPVSPTPTTSTCAIEFATIIVKVLNVRTGPGTTFGIVGTGLVLGQKVGIAEARNGWLRLCTKAVLNGALVDQWISGGTAYVTITLH